MGFSFFLGCGSALPAVHQGGILLTFFEFVNTAE